MSPECRSKNAALNQAETSKQIHVAARQGNAKLLQELLDKKMSYTEVDELGYTAMHMAAKVGSVECVVALLDAASKDEISQTKVLSKLYGRGRDGRTPHMLSVIFGHFKVFKIFVAASSINVRHEAMMAAFCEQNNEPLWYGNRREPRTFFDDNIHKEYFEKSLLSYPIFLNTCQGRPDSAELRRIVDFYSDIRRAVTHTIPELHRAIELGCESSVRELLDEKDVLIVEDRKGNTALHKAAQFGNKTIARLVVNKIRDIYSTWENGISKCCSANFKGDSPLFIASENVEEGVLDIISELYSSDSIDHFNEVQLLHSACRRHDFKALKLIVGKFPELLWRENDDDYYPIHGCAQYGDMAMFTFLLAAGSRLNSLSTDTGYTVLHYAAFNGSPEILKYLLEGFDLNLKTFGKQGDTPLHVAARVGNLAGVQMLLHHGADVAAVRRGWKYAMEEALSGGFFEVAKTLSDATPKVPRNGIILRALRHRDNDFLHLVLKKGFSVHDYSKFWKELLKCPELELSSKLKIMFEHGINVLAVESIMETIIDKLLYDYTDFCRDTFNTLLKYGLLEVDAIAGSNCLAKLCIMKPVMVPSILKPHFEQLPPSMSRETGLAKRIPPRLSNLCRWSIRCSLARSHSIVHPNDIKQLPLAPRFKRFLVFERSYPANIRKAFS